jgi:rhodanese-related sulfurtransferase
MSLSRQEVLDKIRDGALVINVLSAEAHAEKHIEGSINVPLVKDEDTFIRMVEEHVDRYHPVITYCSGSKCSAAIKAGNLLRARGFKAEDYPGGLEDWAQAGLALEGTKVRALAGARGKSR